MTQSSTVAPKRERLLLILAMALGMPAASARAQGPIQAPLPEQRQDVRSEPRVDVSFRNNPSLRVATLFRLDVHVRSQADWREFSEEEAGPSRKPFDVHRARIGIDGRVTRYVEYQFEREMRDAKRPWRDAFVNVRPLRALQVQIGRFKIPFSLDQTTSSMEMDFAHRSLAGSALAPSRDVGVMAHGGAVRNRLRYEAGIFRRGGDKASVADEVRRENQRTVAGRLIARPWNGTKTRRPLRSLGVGAAFTAGRVPEGLNSLLAETISGDRFADRVYVNGWRRRLGAEVQWRPGPASVRSEFIRVSDQRRGQGIDDEDLPDAVQRGWYVSGTWLLTGEDKKDHVEPARPLLQGGLGAFEIAGRVEAFTFGSAATGDAPLPGPRARRIAEARNAASTVGVNWYLNRFVRVQADFVRERRESDGALPPGPGLAWSRLVRVQFQM